MDLNCGGHPQLIVEQRVLTGRKLGPTPDDVTADHGPYAPQGSRKLSK